MKKLKFILIALLLFFACEDFSDYDPVGELKDIPLFHAYINQESYQALLGNRHIRYTVPAEIYYNNTEARGTAEAQGAGSRYLPKWSFEIILEGNNSIEGLTDFNLSAQVGDPSMLRTALASYCYERGGFPTFSSRYIFLRINDVNKGLYYLIERIDEDFFYRRNIPVYELIKVLFGAKFTFTVPNNIYENFEKEINDDGDLAHLEEFIHALDTVKAENIFSLEKFIDLDSYLRYHAVSTFIAAKDGFANNFQMYKSSPEAPYRILPWDFDATFNPKFDGLFYGYNAIIQKLFLNDSCFALYRNYYISYLENHFTEPALFSVIDSAYQEIKTAYDLDPYLGQAGYSLDEEVRKLKEFISQRRFAIIAGIEGFRRPDR